RRPGQCGAAPEQGAVQVEQQRVVPLAERRHDAGPPLGAGSGSSEDDSDSSDDSAGSDFSDNSAGSDFSDFSGCSDFSARIDLSGFLEGSTGSAGSASSASRSEASVSSSSSASAACRNQRTASSRRPAPSSASA